MNISRIPQIMSIKIAEVSINMLFKLLADRYHKQCLTKNIQGFHQWQMNKFIKIKLWIETPFLKSCTDDRVKKKQGNNSRTLDRFVAQNKDPKRIKFLPLIQLPSWKYHGINTHIL